MRFRCSFNSGDAICVGALMYGGLPMVMSKPPPFEGPEYTTDVELKVYVRYTETDVLKILHFDRITEQYRGEDGNYVIGYIRLSELLAKREVLRGKDVFMADFQSFFQELDR